MRAVDLIRHKRDGGALSAEAIDAFVAGVTGGGWPDYQIAALLMAVVWRGMTIDEATELTGAMVASGATLDHGDKADLAVDKHSTGGVGDKTSLILAPLAAACGARVPMMSGRSLGHTGGTLDKLEAIPGFRTHLTLAEMRDVLDRTGCTLIGQTDDVAPADRRLYALRDVTATVESLPLICASILSKKIAEGIHGLVLDVKYGRGAFFESVDDARELARWLVTVSARHGVRSQAVLTSMDAPLGRMVGNANEVIESIETLKGRGPADLESLSVELAARMLVLARLEADEPAAEVRVRRALESGDGLRKFQQIIEAQGGDPAVIDDYGRLPRASGEGLCRAGRDGVVSSLDARAIGRAASLLGAGRDHAEAAVHPGVGIEVLAPVGASVRRGDAVLRLMHDDDGRFDRAMHVLTDAIVVSDRAPERAPLVLDVIDP